jgi:predicted PurR-regulated permease PerM
MQNNLESASTRKIIELILRIGILLLLIYWCYAIIKPFLDILLWSVIFAVALYPMFNWFQKKMRGKKALASSIVIVLMILVLVLPGVLFAKSMYEGINKVKTYMESSTNIIPIASEKVASWPVIGTFVYEKWNWVSTNSNEAVKEYAPQLKEIFKSLISSAASAGVAYIKFIISLIIAGFIVVYANQAGDLAKRLFTKLAGEKGEEYALLAEKTIRTVVRGILGVALIQSTLLGIGMVVAGVPAAGLWFLISLILGIIQIGVFPITIPMVIYMFFSQDTFTAVAFTVWCVIISPLDNVLKPILLGRGALVPMPIIFIGAIGGFIYAGIIGLFTGAIVFSIAYKLFQFWIEEQKGELIG